MSPSTMHLLFLSITGIALLTAVIGNALDLWRLSPSIWPVGQTIIRFGMSISGVSCVAAALSAWAMGAGWRERILWELAADGGFAVLSIGLLVGAIERDIMRRRAAMKRGEKRYSAGHGD